MAMLPEINVLNHPTASGPRSLTQSSGPRPLPTSHFTPPVVGGQPNYVLRRLSVIVAVVATTVVSIVGIGSAGAERAADAPQVVVPETEAADVLEGPGATLVIVQPGDTLWTIAERVAPTVDRRKAVDELAKIAGGSMLEVGQRLEIPAVFG